MGRNPPAHPTQTNSVLLLCKLLQHYGFTLIPGAVLWCGVVFLPSMRPPTAVDGGTIAVILFLLSSAPVPAKLGGVSPIFDFSSLPSGKVVYQQEICSTCLVVLEGLVK
jgi:hypothetical protein